MFNVAEKHFVRNNDSRVQIPVCRMYAALNKRHQAYHNLSLLAAHKEGLLPDATLNYYTLLFSWWWLQGITKHIETMIHRFSRIITLNMNRWLANKEKIKRWDWQKLWYFACCEFVGGVLWYNKKQMSFKTL